MGSVWKRFWGTSFSAEPRRTRIGQITCSKVFDHSRRFVSVSGTVHFNLSFSKSNRHHYFWSVVTYASGERNQTMHRVDDSATFCFLSLQRRIHVEQLNQSFSLDISWRPVFLTLSVCGVLVWRATWGVVSWWRDRRNLLLSTVVQSFYAKISPPTRFPIYLDNNLFWQFYVDNVLSILLLYTVL